MGKFGLGGVGAIHPHIEVDPTKLMYVVDAEGAKSIGSHVLDDVGMTDEIRAELLEDELNHGVVLGDVIDIDETEMVGMHIEETGELLLSPEPNARQDYTGVGLYL